MKSDVEFNITIKFQDQIEQQKTEQSVILDKKIYVKERLITNRFNQHQIAQALFF